MIQSPDTSRPPAESATAAAVNPRFAELDRLATRLDSQFRIPGTGIRFGWDGIIGLIPGVGDAASLLPAGYILAKAVQMGARRRTVTRMALNTGIDILIGGIPLLGDAFDVWFKSNRRNIGLLRRELEQQSRV